MNLQARRNEDPEVNLISLIDVVLMLIVFFMLSSTFIEEGRVRIRLPQADTIATRAEKTSPIVVGITRSGSYSVNNRELINTSAETLRAALLAVAREQRGQRVTLRADAAATHQAVVRALDVLGKLGFREVHIATVDTTPPAAP
ncbi:MAG: biopolymer transporter ExbD [Steroidobacteraceae bacterium]|nr:biopolymer transporter ExbD [Steroidobacteraceae bacterium]MDW8259507.1 biopolymer transporter ExbD [Gammaproteobacteria bacterium]